MIRGFLLDEHLPVWWRPTIFRLQPHLRLFRVGDAGAPPLRSSDSVVLEWCASHQFAFITNNRRTIPFHLAALTAQGRHVPGVFISRASLSIEVVAENLDLLAGASLPDEFQDQIRYLPIV